MYILQATYTIRIDQVYWVGNVQGELVLVFSRTPFKCKLFTFNLKTVSHTYIVHMWVIKL